MTSYICAYISIPERLIKLFQKMNNSVLSNYCQRKFIYSIIFATLIWILKTSNYTKQILAFLFDMHYWFCFLQMKIHIHRNYNFNEISINIEFLLQQGFLLCLEVDNNISNISRKVSVGVVEMLFGIQYPIFYRCMLYAQKYDQRLNVLEFVTEYFIWKLFKTLIFWQIYWILKDLNVMIWLFNCL